jgi:hypothetical protein
MNSKYIIKNITGKTTAYLRADFSPSMCINENNIMPLNCKSIKYPIKQIHPHKIREVQ